MKLFEQKQKFSIVCSTSILKKQYFMKVFLLQDIWKGSIKSGLLLILHIFKVLYQI